MGLAGWPGKCGRMRDGVHAVCVCVLVLVLVPRLAAEGATANRGMQCPFAVPPHTHTPVPTPPLLGSSIQYYIRYYIRYIHLHPCSVAASVTTSGTYPSAR